MKRTLIIFSSVIYFLSTCPALALSSDTHVIPLIGPLADKANNFIEEKIELATIKLPPKKIFGLELLEAERTFTPKFLSDHFGIWTSPLRVKYKDLYWFVPASGILTALFLTDNDFESALTNNFRPKRLQRDISNAFGQIGGYGPTLGVPGSLIAIGFLTKNDKLRETGVLQLKSVAHASLLYLAVSRIAGRNKPNNLRKGPGEFFESGTSFPSGHTLNAFAVASVLVHEYSDKKWIPFVVYPLASVIASSRVVQGTHFPSDVFAAAVAGILIGRYVVKHNSKFAPGADYNNKEKT